ncbi:MAG: hypothetical protein DRI97_03250 [Bacteroidetes bacterium]|nr:MAG: hypothetical protein DRI97_03250 [Bacteroidota bacterium]
MLLLAGMAILYTGCTKDEETDPNQSDNREAEVDATKDDALADKLFSELTDITDEAMRNNEKSYKGIVLDTIFMGPCVTVTIDTLSFPFTITIDFGDVNCECNDGKWRRGKIHVEHSGPYWAVGTVITTSLEDYYVNNHLLTGTKIATNQGLNTNNNPTWTIHVDGQVVKPDGGVITWVGDRMREWAQGHNTPFLWWDDVYMLTGSHNVVASNGSTLSATIIEGLQVALNCYWIEAGIIELQHSDLPLIVLDYGQGVCDDDAVVYIDGTPYPIKL